MANKVKGEVSLVAPGGETYLLVFGFESLVLVEDKRDKAFGDVVEELKKGRLGSLGALLWAGIQQHHPDVEFETAGRVAMALTGAGRGKELQNKIIEAINAGFPSAKEVGDAGSRPQTEGAGNSTSNAASELGSNSN